jgi:hypothetical protein
VKLLNKAERQKLPPLFLEEGGVKAHLLDKEGLGWLTSFLLNLKPLRYCFLRRNLNIFSDFNILLSMAGSVFLIFGTGVLFFTFPAQNYSVFNDDGKGKTAPRKKLLQN